MRVAIYQPQYFPRLHYINRALHADTFVLLSSAQYTKSLVHVDGEGQRSRHKSFQADAPVKLPSGVHQLTVPIRGKKPAPLDESSIDYSSNWVARHLQTLKAAYGRAVNYDRYAPEVEEILRRRPETLAELDTLTVLWAITRILSMEVPVGDLSASGISARLPAMGARIAGIVSDGDLDAARPEGRQRGTEWTIAICRALGATEYVYGGTAGAGYMDAGAYEAEGIGLVRQDWTCREYPQRFGEVGFVANLSVLDLLFNAGPETARVVLEVEAEAAGAAVGVTEMTAREETP